MQWLNTYAPTIIVGLCVLALLVMAVRKIRSDKKSGCACSACPGGCSGCSVKRESGGSAPTPPQGE